MGNCVPGRRGKALERMMNDRNEWDDNVKARKSVSRDEMMQALKEMKINKAQ